MESPDEFLKTILEFFLFDGNRNEISASGQAACSTSEHFPEPQPYTRTCRPLKPIWTHAICLQYRKLGSSSTSRILCSCSREKVSISPTNSRIDSSRRRFACFGFFPLEDCFPQERLKRTEERRRMIRIVDLCCLLQNRRGGVFTISRTGSDYSAWRIPQVSVRYNCGKSDRNN